jgi:hypothetical protein
MTTFPYTATRPPLPETADELRARIPGWGADLDPRDRPAVPRLQARPGLSGGRPEPPDQQQERVPRERSIEHAFLTPVFGTTCPTKGVSGAIRRYSYARYSEGRAAHWLLLMAADRVDVLENTLRALVAGRPDNPVAESGVRSELSHHGVSSRAGHRRTDVVHQALDPVIVAGPWVLAGAATAAVARRVIRARRRA